MDQREFDLLTRVEAGQSVFRPVASTDWAREAFQETVGVLLSLRQKALIQFPDGRIARNESGQVMLVGPCDLSEAGRRALEQDRRLGPRP